MPELAKMLIVIVVPGQGLKEDFLKYIKAKAKQEMQFKDWKMAHSC